MALKATIHKAKVQVSDLDQNAYSDHELTIARHPSETDERMMIRVLAFALNAPSNNDLGALELAKDMWDPDEPALWQKDHTGLLMHWIELGQPDEKRIMKACGRSKRVTVYTYGGAASAWWKSAADKVAKARNLTVWQIPDEQCEELGALADRSMDIQITVQDGAIYISEGDRSVELTLQALCGGPD